MNINIDELRVLAVEEQKRIEPIIRKLLDKCYRKPYELESRIKSEKSLLRKQKRFCEKYGDNISKIPDILGFRISVHSLAECSLVAQLIEEYLNPDRLLDFYNNPKESGFQAYLYYFTNRGVCIEMQIMTQKMRDWTNSTHDEHELRKYDSVLTENNNKTK